jgi:hypothetical protein
MYIIGKTGMGKTTMMENMVLHDIYSGHGVGVVDPHGDFAEKIINYIPPKRINDVVYFNPADVANPIGFNILEVKNDEQKHLIASGLMGVFKKIWPDVWSARMEYILNNTILALLDYPDTTLMGINRLLADDDYREKVVKNLKDPVVRSFWVDEFAKYEERFRREAIAPIQNKIGQFLSASIIRNIVAQVKSRINIREIMDTKKIFIMNLSKGRIGEDNSRLMGGMLITKIQLSAMERVDTPEAQRSDFFLYVDEFQNFATESFANILSEARKYRLDLIMAHQYMEQLDEKVLAAVIGNVGTMVTFRVGSSDAEILAKEFIPTFVEEDLVNLPKFHVYLKLMIDGVASRPFSALTLPPIGSTTHSREKVIRVSRERYAVPRDKIEDKIARWSGMIVDDGEEGTVDGESKEPKSEKSFQKSSGDSSGSKDQAKSQFSNQSKNSNYKNEDRKAPPRNDSRERSSSKSDFQPRKIQSFKKNVDLTAGETEAILLTNPDQKGLSLSQILRNPPPPQAKSKPKSFQGESSERSMGSSSKPLGKPPMRTSDNQQGQFKNLPPRKNNDSFTTQRNQTRKNTGTMVKPSSGGQGSSVSLKSLSPQPVIKPSVDTVKSEGMSSSQDKQVKSEVIPAKVLPPPEPMLKELPPSPPVTPNPQPLQPGEVIKFD